MAKAGRPEIILTPEQWDQAQAMAKIHCSGEEIASLLDVSYDALIKNIKSKGYKDFTDWFKKYSAGGKMSLRRKQYKMVMEKDSVPMAIWLGKQWLGQKDQQDLDMTIKPEKAFDTSKMSKEEYMAHIRGMFGMGDKKDQ